MKKLWKLPLPPLVFLLVFYHFNDVDTTTDVFNFNSKEDVESCNSTLKTGLRRFLTAQDLHAFCRTTTDIVVFCGKPRITTDVESVLKNIIKPTTRAVVQLQLQ
jgi:hypothetical protein